MKWLRELSVRNKFSIIILLIAFILIYGMINFWFGLKIMSGVRAYVGGEGLWSKSQKEATINLIKYTRTFSESDYQNFIAYLQVPLGDKIARLELNKKNPDLEIVRRGFIQGGNSPEDVDDLVFLYRRFKDVGHMKIAVKDWTEGDAEIEKLLKAGERIHSIGQSVGDYSKLSSDATASAQLNSLIEDVYRLDRELTVIENHFSATLSEGSRWMRDFLLVITISLSVLLGSVAIVIAVYMGKVTVRVDKMKSEFVSLVSHELRTPLTAIIGITSMILKGEYSFNANQLRQPLLDIKASSTHLIRLVNDLLEISRIQSGKLKVDLQDVNLSQAIQKNVQIMEMLAKQKGTVITFNVLKEVSVAADVEKLEQILYNLIGNAIKFTERGLIEINMSQKGDRVLVAIRDTGEGISKKDKKHLFGRFEQTAVSRSSRQGGLGLGLYLSRALARRMGGEVRLESSEVGSGSTFIVELLKAKTSAAQKLKVKLGKEFV